MSLMNSIGKKIFSSTKLKKRDFDPERMSVEDIVLPTSLRLLETDNLRGMIKSQLDTYKSLGYHDLPTDQLKAVEYNSWEVGIILKFLKEDLVYPLHNIEEILPSMVFQITKRQLHIKVFTLVISFDNRVDHDDLKPDLEEDKLWSPLDVAYLLRYASMEERAI